MTEWHNVVMECTQKKPSSDDGKESQRAAATNVEGRRRQTYIGICPVHLIPYGGFDSDGKLQDTALARRGSHAPPSIPIIGQSEATY